MRVQKVRARPIPSKKCHETEIAWEKPFGKESLASPNLAPPEENNYGNMKETQRERESERARERGQARDGLDT